MALWVPTRADLLRSIPEEALVGIDPAKVLDVLADSARKVSGYLPAQYGEIDPDNVPRELTRAATDLAAYDLLVGNRVNPDDPSAETYALRAAGVTRWLERLSEGKIALTLPDLTPGVEEGAPEVVYPDAVVGEWEDFAVDRRRGF